LLEGVGWQIKVLSSQWVWGSLGCSSQRV
jgi:hypothetical protein